MSLYTYSVWADIVNKLKKKQYFSYVLGAEQHRIFIINSVPVPIKENKTNTFYMDI